MRYIVFALFIINASFAQLNFYEGYIVSENDDTLKGEIKANPKKELSLYSKVMFRDKQGFTKTYKSNKIKSFGYLNTKNNKWHTFIAIKEDESKFYKLTINHPIVIYEYQYEEMKVGGDFYVAKQYYIKQNNDFIRVKSKKLKKVLSEHIDNTEILSEIEKMEDIDVEKLSSLLEKYYSKSSS